MKKKIIAFCLVFLSGFLLMLSLNFYSDWKYEEDIVTNLGDEIKAKCGSTELVCLVDTAMRYTHMVQDPMRNIFSEHDFSTPKFHFTRHSFSNFYFGRGECGAYAAFFSRVIDKLGYKNKFVILDTRKGSGKHIIIAIEDGSKLYLVDPFYGHTFKDSNGKLSEIHAVSKNWAYYSKYLPAGYDESYDYQYGWRYTNWQKMGAFSGAVRKMLSLFMSKEEIEGLSLRYHITQWGKYLAGVAMIGFLLCLWLAVRAVFHKPKTYSPAKREAGTNVLTSHT